MKQIKLTLHELLLLLLLSNLIVKIINDLGVNKILEMIS